MGLETPTRGLSPMTCSSGGGEDFVWEGEDLSDVTVVTLGLTRKGRPLVQHDLISANGKLDTAFVPLDGEEATGVEAPNAVLVRLLPTSNFLRRARGLPFQGDSAWRLARRFDQFFCVQDGAFLVCPIVVVEI